MTPTPRVTPICDANALIKLLKDYEVLPRKKYVKLCHKIIWLMRDYWPEMSLMKFKER